MPKALVKQSRGIYLQFNARVCYSSDGGSGSGSSTPETKMFGGQTFGSALDYQNSKRARSYSSDRRGLLADSKAVQLMIEEMENGWKIKKEVRIYNIKQLYTICVYNIRCLRMHEMTENEWKIKKEVRIYSIKQQYVMCMYSIRCFRVHVMIENGWQIKKEVRIYRIKQLYMMCVYSIRRLRLSVGVDRGD